MISAAGFAAETAPDTGVADAEVRFPAGTTQGKKTVYVYTTAEGPADTPTIVDLTNETGAPRVTWTLVKEVSRAAAPAAGITPATIRVEWQFIVDVNELPAEASVLRVAQLSRGTVSRTFRYTLTNRPKTFTWALTPPVPTVVLPGNTEVTFFTSTATEAQSGIKLVIAKITLLDDDGRSLDRKAFSLTDANNAEPTLPVTGIRPLLLTIDDSKLQNGKFTGSIEIAADGSNDVKSFPLTISRSSACARRLAWLLIALGVALSIVIGVFARNAVARAEALMPATRLIAFLDAAHQRLQNCGAAEDVTSLANALQRVRSDLSATNLGSLGYIPSIFGAPLRSTAAPTDYAAYLQARSDAIAAYAYIVDHGACEVAQVKKQNPPTTAAQQAAFGTAFKTIGTLAVAPPPYDMTQIRAAVITALTTLSTAIGLARKGEAAPATETPSTQQLLFTIDMLNVGAWAIWAVVTVVAGGAILIISNPAFGTSLDFVKCFLWGLGVQVAGQQLQQLLPNGVASALGITMPKATP
jgi:hypothetical protein